MLLTQQLQTTSSTEWADTCQSHKSVTPLARVRDSVLPLTKVHTADLKTMHTTLRQEIPQHHSVNTGDLFHTLSDLSTTLLLLWRQVCLNEQYHSDTRGSNNERLKPLEINVHRQRHIKRKTGNKTEKGTKIQTECACSFSSQQFTSLRCGSGAACNMEQHCFSSGCY